MGQAYTPITEPMSSTPALTGGNAQGWTSQPDGSWAPVTPGNPPVTSAVIAAGQTASKTIPVAVPSDLRHMVLVLNTVTASAGNTVQVTVNGVTASGYVYPILTGVAVATVAVTPYRVGVGFTASPNAVANDALPPTVQIVVTVAGTVAYGLDVILAS